MTDKPSIKDTPCPITLVEIFKAKFQPMSREDYDTFAGIGDGMIAELGEFIVTLELELDGNKNHTIQVHYAGSGDLLADCTWAWKVPRYGTQIPSEYLRGQKAEKNLAVYYSCIVDGELDQVTFADDDAGSRLAKTRAQLLANHGHTVYPIYIQALSPVVEGEEKAENTN